MGGGVHTNSPLTRGVDFGALGGEPARLSGLVLVEVGGVLVVAVHGHNLLQSIQISLKELRSKEILILYMI